MRYSWSWAMLETNYVASSSSMFTSVPKDHTWRWCEKWAVTQLAVTQWMVQIGKLEHNLKQYLLKCIHVTLEALVVHIKSDEIRVKNNKCQGEIEILHQTFSPPHICVKWVGLLYCWFWKVTEITGRIPPVLMLERCGGRGFRALFDSTTRISFDALWQGKTEWYAC